MYGIIRKHRLSNLQIICKFDLLDKAVFPFLICGCKIWGYENLKDEAFQICVSFQIYEIKQENVLLNE